MKVFTLTLLAGAAVALIAATAPATSAGAQDEPAVAAHSGDWTLRQREDWLRDRIDKSLVDGSLDRVEADRVRHELGDIRAQEGDMRDRHDGQLTDNETAHLEARLDNVASTIHWMHETNFEHPW
jgi:hypothetical protein